MIPLAVVAYLGLCYLYELIEWDGWISDLFCSVWGLMGWFAIWCPVAYYFYRNR